MNLFNQPLRAYIRMTAAVAIFGMTSQLAVAQTPHPSIREVARKEVARMAAADARALVLPPNYPRTFAGPVPTSRLGRQVVAGTAGAVGGFFAGMLIGTGVARANGCTGECSLTGLFIGAPIGAVSGAITGALLTR